jgi:hypothetical protein
MKYKIQMLAYRYNPVTGCCSKEGTWTDWPEEFSTREEAVMEMNRLMLDEGHWPDELRVVELSLTIK